MITSKITYKLFAEYYDLYAGNYTDDLDFYKSLCKKEDRVIEIGCGTGRVLKHFLHAGFKITGVDISDEMLDITKNKFKEFEQSGKLVLLNHDFSDGILAGQFDKALVTFYTFNYIIHEPGTFLKNVYNSLAEHAIIVLDLFYPQSIANKYIENKWTEHGFEINNRKINLRDKRRMEGSIEHRIQIYRENSKEIQIDTERKYYKPQEMKELLEQSGFKNVLFSLTFQNNKFMKEIDEKDLVKNYIVKAEK